MISYVCPSCRSTLNTNGSEYVCSCGEKYAAVDEIPVFSRSSEYYGEVPKDRKMNILERMKNGEHWRQVVWSEFAESYAYLHHIITDETRNDFRFHLPVGVERVLDLGTGWGTMSCYFAQDCKEVYALDGTIDRCQFVKRRCLQDGIKNVYPVCASILQHPFPDGTFDIVIMNGVLEWVAASVTEGDPRTLQLEALKSVRRMLKSNGVLYIGIENSHGFKYIVGANDDHTGIPHIVYLSRETASAKASKELKHSYRTYTYDMEGYRELLKDAGFGTAQFHYPVPDYKSLNFMVPLENDTTWRHFNSEVTQASEFNSMPERVRALEEHAISRGTFSHHVASYSIMAGEHPASFVDRIKSQLVEHHSTYFSTKPNSLDLLQISAPTGKIFGTGRIKFLAFVDGKKSPDLVVTMCRARNYEESLEKERIVCQELPKGIAFEVPRHLGMLDVDGRECLVTRADPARSIETRRLNDRFITGKNDLEENARADFALAARCLSSLHSVTRSEGTRKENFTDRVRFYLKGEAEFEREYLGMLDSVLKNVSITSSCLVHGDFTPSNVLTGSERATVIDWELSESSSYPILDYGRFVLYYFVMLSRLDSQFASLEDTLRTVFVERKGWLAEESGKFLQEGLGLDRGAHIEQMRLLLIHEALLQMEHSCRPATAVARSYLNRLKALV